ncbi:hypothetical protein [Bradyrhizobium uaiense]|uniref:Invasion associated locus B family protein n=1 Tax=Bradyrhizobium uaiense TaxID=2594946 RepID=A0A6P1BII3_9BRAD|nr:hypothetical protein [Bradyrhizobium uaiense]NEU97342.1 hypothetical protein [Bradyrhizobium uaiense]
MKVTLSLPMTRLTLLCTVLMVLAHGSGRTETPRPDGPRPSMMNCASGVSPEQRRRCDEEAFRQVESGSQSTQLEGGWRLVRSRDPEGGSDAISAMHVVDSSESDPRLAGLSLQCGRDGIDVALIVLEPLARSERPTVALAAGGKRAEFEASVVQGGAALRLPANASKLVAGDWQSTAELSVEIATKPNAILGVVPISGLSTALSYLSQNCHVK